VLLRDGGVFGPVVNLAARVVKVAAPGEIIAPAAVVRAAGMKGESLGRQVLKGVDEHIELCRLVAP
jgi:class 3 adenylate cyclase